MHQGRIDQLIETYQLDYSKGLLTSEQLMRLVYRLDRMSFHSSHSSFSGRPNHA